MTSVPSAPVSSPSMASVSMNAVQRGRGGHEKTLGAVAQKLGLSTDDLKQALASGRSLADVAASKGVGKDDLVSTIAGTLPAVRPDGGPVDATAMAARIAVAGARRQQQ